MQQLRRFLPYAVTITCEEKPLQLRHSFGQSRRLRWSIVVVDREYDLLFASWLHRKPTSRQILSISLHGLRGWDEQKGGMIHLYDDGCVPTDGLTHWQQYQQRLGALARLRCLTVKGRGGERWSDYRVAIDAWHKVPASDLI